MTFTASSVFLVLLILGQIGQDTHFDNLKPLNSATEVHEALTLSCRALNETGPIDGGSLNQLVEFQKESWLRLQRRQEAFIKNHCEAQKEAHVARTLTPYILAQRPRNYWLADPELMTPVQNPLLPEPIKAQGPVFPEKDQEDISLRVGESSPNLIDESVNDPNQFQCDEEKALSEFSQEFGEGIDALESQLSLFADFRIPDFIEFWDAFCLDTPQSQPPEALNYNQLAREYNALLRESRSVDVSFLDNYRTSRGADIYDDRDEWIGPFLDNGRVIRFTPIEEIPEIVKQAFIAAEDRNFYTHRGVELRGVLRGFFRYMRDGTIEGGSTITQQLVKNVLLDNEVSLERKAQEMLLARRLEDRLSKEQILEAYLNIVFLGRGAQGLGAATERYFGSKQKVSDLDLNQASYFAGITHSPNRYNPTLTTNDRIKSRQSYVLNEMIRAEFISREQAQAALTEDLNFVPLVFPPMSYFQAAVSQEYLRTTEPNTPTPERIESSQSRPLQRQVDALVQKHLSEFEMRRGRVYWRGPLRNIAYLWRNRESRPNLSEETEIWRDELIKSESLFSGVNWQVAVLLDTQNQHTIGLIDEDEQAITARLAFGDVGGDWFSAIRSQLQVGDVLFVEKKESGYFFRVSPTVQMSIVVMDVNTGEIKALSGGFDYSVAPYNRGLRALRQPGSTVKPFTYLAALDQGFRRDDTLPNRNISFPSIPGCRSWSPRNYSQGGGAASMSFETALIQSNNRATAYLLENLSFNPANSLRYIFNTMRDFGLYPSSQGEGICYPLILGSNEVTPLRMATAFAAVANGGWRVRPTFLKKPKGEFDAIPLQQYSRQSVLELSQILSRVITNGTGQALNEHAGRVAGKTGTSSSYRDAWFAGYSNDHVVVGWMGYDRSRMTLPGGRRVNLSMGSGSTGGRIVAPVVNQVFSYLFNEAGDRALPMDSGERLARNPSEFRFDHVWRNEVAQVASSSWLNPTLGGQFFSRVEDRLGPGEATPIERLSHDSPIIPIEEITGETPQQENLEDNVSPELEGVRREDAWQSMQDRARELLDEWN